MDGVTLGVFFTCTSKYICWQHVYLAVRCLAILPSGASIDRLVHQVCGGTFASTLPGRDEFPLFFGLAWVGVFISWSIAFVLPLPLPLSRVARQRTSAAFVRKTNMLLSGGYIDATFHMLLSVGRTRRDLSCCVSRLLRAIARLPCLLLRGWLARETYTWSWSWSCTSTHGS